MHNYHGGRDLLWEGTTRTSKAQHATRCSHPTSYANHHAGVFTYPTQVTHRENQRMHRTRCELDDVMALDDAANVSGRYKQKKKKNKLPVMFHKKTNEHYT